MDALPMPSKSLADAALAQMMLHRRRAVVAEVINEFFVGAGIVLRPIWAVWCRNAPDFAGRN